MATHPWLYACLLAVVMTAGAMPVDAGLDPLAIRPPSADGPACTNADDDQGMGGTHVTCYYNCGPAALLIIGVKASDSQAYSYGNTDCGGAEASCTEPAPVCVEPSATLTSTTQEAAACNGHSDEIWDSPVKVACVATTGHADPKDIMCRYAKICPKDVSLEELCAAVAPADLLGGLAPLVGRIGAAASGVAFQIEGGLVQGVGFSNGVCVALTPIAT